MPGLPSDHCCLIMFNDQIEPKWVDVFEAVIALCKVDHKQSVVILSESQSRHLNIALTELALAKIGVNYFHIKVPSPLNAGPAILRSSGSSVALDNQAAAVKALCEVDFIVDLTVEGLMHSKQTTTILKSGARILTISNEHPEALERMWPDPMLKERVREAAALCKKASSMQVSSAAGTDLSVNLKDTPVVGVWGWTDRPGTLAHWPGGIVVCFPGAGTINGRLVLQPGDINLTFKRYLESEVVLTIENDYAVKIEGKGTDYLLMKNYLESFGDRECYAVSHVGWGLNPAARYEALTMYDQRDTNGTELRALAGNFLFSTGANEFAGRFTDGHFDLPMLGCTIELDGKVVVNDGTLV
ncbi:MAG: 2,5-dihydroxypyridine 5,6-dioxygenase [Parasphingorhabdus sp.]|jgi:2,5-dihydroxypyridine 5,6-dioxygenase